MHLSCCTDHVVPLTTQKNLVRVCASFASCISSRWAFEACESVISNFGTLDRQRTIISMNFGAFLDHLVALLCHLSRLNSRVLWASSWLPPIFWRWCSAWPFSGMRAGGIVLGWTSGEKRRRQKKERNNNTPHVFSAEQRGWRQSSEFTYPVQTVQKSMPRGGSSVRFLVSRLDQVPVTREMSSQWPAGHTFLEFLRISILHFVWHLASVTNGSLPAPKRAKFPDLVAIHLVAQQTCSD